MPQIFQVLKCYKCSVFQVHQTRKDNKWICKLCSEKQSVKRHYGIGTAKDCRFHVQKLNKMRGEKEETIKTYVSDNSDCDDTDNPNNTKNNKINISSMNDKSKWSAYVDELQNVDANEPQYLNNEEVVLEVPQKRKSSMLYSKQNKYTKSIAGTKRNNSNNINEVIEDKICCNVKSNESSMQENKLTKTIHSITLHTLENLNPQDSVPPLNRLCIPRSSKWHQYLNEDNTNVRQTPDEFIENCSTKSDFLFSLNDDKDIDKILDL